MNSAVIDFSVVMYVFVFGYGKVEAYRPNDSACHGRFGVTARTAPVVRF